MYENMTVENILNDMLAQFGPDVRTDEGSLAYNACAKIADALETAYEELEDIQNNLTPDTMDLQHLIAYGEQVGIIFEEATAAIVKGEFTQEITKGTQFYCGEFTYTAGDPIANTSYHYLLICDEEGSGANANIGELVPVDYIDDFQGGSITEVLVPGKDDEDEEAYRSRILNSYGAKPFGGNRADYRKFIDDMDNVAACKPKRRADNSPWINIYILDQTYGVPSSDIVNEVQDLVDPVTSHGEGDGMAPICHKVQIMAASAVSISITATITFDSGYSAESCQTEIEKVVKDYLLTLRQEWESNDLGSTVVRVSQIEAKILTVKGVIDIADVTINGAAENLVLSYEKVPIFGEVIINV